MKRYILSVFAMLHLALVLPALAEQPGVPPDGIRMANTRQPVVFNHSTHQKDMKCNACHHDLFGRGAAYGKCSDVGCHNGMFRNETSFRNYYHVIHGKVSAKFATCVSCHRQAAEQTPSRKKELTACKQSKCHP